MTKHSDSLIDLPCNTFTLCTFTSVLVLDVIIDFSTLLLFQFFCNFYIIHLCTVYQLHINMSVCTTKLYYKTFLYSTELEAQVLPLSIGAYIA